MKKILSMFLAAIMVFAFSSIAFAATEIEFEIAAYDADYENEITEINAGETFAIAINAGSQKIKVLAAIIGYNNEVFEVLTEEGTYDLGAFFGEPVVRDDSAFVFGGVNSALKKVDCYYQIKVKDNAPSGDYTFKFLGCDEAFIKGANGEATYSGNDVTIKVNGTAPAPAGPAWEKLDNVTVVEFVGEDAEDKDYAYAVDFVANDAAKLIYSVATDNARLYSVAKDVTGLAGAIKAGFVSRTQYDAASVGVLLTNAAEDTIWYSVDADKAE